MPKWLSVEPRLIRPTKDCFFTCDCGRNWHPGWVVAKIHLPIVEHSSEFRLVCSANGEYQWIAANRIKYRGETHLFDTDRYQHKFNWNKYRIAP
jgi:hypothetical protein